MFVSFHEWRRESGIPLCPSPSFAFIRAGSQKIISKCASLEGTIRQEDEQTDDLSAATLENSRHAIHCALIKGREFNVSGAADLCSRQ